VRREHGVSTWVRNSLTLTDLHKMHPIILEDLFGVMTPQKKKQKQKREALAALTIFC